MPNKINFLNESDRVFTENAIAKYGLNEQEVIKLLSTNPDEIFTEVKYPSPPAKEYLISDRGRCFSFYSAQFLNPRKYCGNEVYVLGVKGKTQRVIVSKTVLFHFCDLPIELMDNRQKYRTFLIDESKENKYSIDNIALVLNSHKGKNLSLAQAREIRDKGKRLDEDGRIRLAQSYSTDKYTVSAIAHGEAWEEIPCALRSAS